MRNLLNTYEAAIDNANEYNVTVTADYFLEVAENWDMPISVEEAELMLNCYKDWEENGKDQTDYYEMVEAKLSEV